MTHLTTRPLDFLADRHFRSVVFKLKTTRIRKINQRFDLFGCIMDQSSSFWVTFNLQKNNTNEERIDVNVFFLLLDRCYHIYAIKYKNDLYMLGDIHASETIIFHLF